MNNKIQVLDKGYVRYLDKMGNDESVVNAARVSYDRESESFDENDQKLLNYLFSHGHTSPLRHTALSLEIYAPLMVARQWWKYAVGSSHVEDQNGWNESSRRYITEEEEFYKPEFWRSKPSSSKQGSGEALWGPDFEELSNALDWIITLCESWYEEALDLGVAPEQARLFLPAYSMYVRWRWTASLEAVLHFLDQRLKNDAQYEIREYAAAVYKLAEKEFPAVLSSWEHRSKEN
jgi:thymidylate synthase (FAD)